MRLKSMSHQYDYSLPDISSIDDKQQKNLDLYYRFSLWVFITQTYYGKKVKVILIQNI